MAKIKIAGAALNQTALAWDNNLENIRQVILQARQEQVRILCLPELCITGYGCEDWFLSNWVPETAVNLLPEIALLCEDITVAIGLPVGFRQKVYNCACIIRNKKILGITAKQNMAVDGVHYEPRWFTAWKPGEIDTFELQGEKYPFGDILYEIDGYKVGFEICEDAWREDIRPASRFFEKGVQIILNPSASHFAFRKTTLRENLVKASSEKFDCVYVYANLLGNEAGRMIYDGEILIGQKGLLVIKNKLLSFKNINLICAEVDIAEPEKTIIASIPEEKDINLEFTKAVALALFDYLRKSKSKGFVLSLSGGADSSACAVLVAEMIKIGTEALGFEAFLHKIGLPELVVKIGENQKPEGGSIGKVLSNEEKRKIICGRILTTAYQATKNSSQETENSARYLAESLGAVFHRWNIDNEVNGYTSKVENALQRKLSWETDDIALQNIQARTRSPIIWMLANIKNALLITTSNRSEGDVGYATMDGDTSGSIAPIAAVDKFFLLNWLQWAEKELHYEGLQQVNKLAPSAELRPPGNQQTDEGDLMPYELLKEIEILAIREKKSPTAVFDILHATRAEPAEKLKAYIVKFFKLWARNQWKRERIAPSFHLDDFNIDPRTWCRFPILSGGFEKELEVLDRHVRDLKIET